MELVNVIDWSVTIILAVAVYFLYHKRTLRINLTQQLMSERLGRWNVVSELERDIMEIHATEFALEEITAKDAE